MCCFVFIDLFCNSTVYKSLHLRNNYLIFSGDGFLLFSVLDWKGCQISFFMLVWYQCLKFCYQPYSIVSYSPAGLFIQGVGALKIWQRCSRILPSDTWRGEERRGEERRGEERRFKADTSPPASSITAKRSNSSITSPLTSYNQHLMAVTADCILSRKFYSYFPSFFPATFPLSVSYVVASLLSLLLSSTSKHYLCSWLILTLLFLYRSQGFLSVIVRFWQRNMCFQFTGRNEENNSTFVGKTLIVFFFWG